MKRSLRQFALYPTIAALSVAASFGARQRCLAEGEKAAPTFSTQEVELILQHSPLPPAPPDPSNRVADDPRAARLGHFLFFDPRLSSNGQVSCATCHDPGHHFSDGRQLSFGISNGVRNTPALWNVAHNRWYFWDGRADSLWAQAIQPLERDIEMDGDRVAIAQLMCSDPALRAAYEHLFGELPQSHRNWPEHARPMPDTPNHEHHLAWHSMPPEDQRAVNQILVYVAKCIAAYERLIISRQSPFDQFVSQLQSEETASTPALGDSAQRGLRLFIGRGNCRICHAGPNFTDGEFHDVRVISSGPFAPHDPSRAEGVRRAKSDPFNLLSPFSDDQAGATADKVKFLSVEAAAWNQVKTPSLRNVALTAPYMHQGQFLDLESVLDHYSTFDGARPPGHHDVREQILQPLNLTEQERADLIAFLQSLTDTSIDESLLRAPTSPALEDSNQ